MTSVVMIGRNRLRLTKQAIESIYANTKREDFTLVYVDDGSDDFRVLKFLRSISHPNFSLLEIHNSNHTLATLKNIGVEWSAQRFGYESPLPYQVYSGDWLAIFDNDVCFFPGWLPKMIDAMQRSDFGPKRRVQILGGCRHPFHGVNKLWGDEGYIEEADAVAGYSHFMRWPTWEVFGPLPRDCASGIGQSEDFWLSQQITRTGDSVGYINPPVLAHCGVTDSNGNPAIGADQFMRVPGVIYE